MLESIQDATALLKEVRSAIDYPESAVLDDLQDCCNTIRHFIESQEEELKILDTSLTLLEALL